MKGTGKTGSGREYPNAGNASNKDNWNDGPGGRSYPGKRADPENTDKVKKQSVGADCIPPGPARPGMGCSTEYRQKGSSRSYPNPTKG